MSSRSAPYVCTLSPELVKKAEEELKEKPEWRARDIQALRDMVNAHPGLHCRTDDSFLLRFLRVRKFDYDRAYQLILNYFTVRDEHKELFKDLLPSKLGKILDDNVCIVLPNRDKEGRRIILLRPGKWDIEAYDIWTLMLSEVINVELIVQEEETQINGMLMVADMTDFGMQHVKNFKRSYAKAATTVYEDAFPMRMKGARVIHEHAIFTTVFNIVKPFMREKFQKRFIFYNEDLDGLAAELGADTLPEELGGTLGPVANLEQEWKKKVLAAESYFEELRTYYLDVPKQITKKTTDEAVESIVGTYKKLNVD